MRSPPNRLWWLSFCDATLPVGSQFIGACIVPGENMGHALQVAHLLKCNPGGEVEGFEIPAERTRAIWSDEIGKLMSRDECAKFGERV